MRDKESIELEALRCVDCSKISTAVEIKKFGMCPNCGTRRFKNVLILKEEELSELREKGVSEDFCALFEGVLHG